MAEDWEREAAARASGNHGRASFDSKRTSNRLPYAPRVRGSFEMTHSPAHRGSFVEEHVSHLRRLSGSFTGYSLDMQQLPGARVNSQLRTSLRPDGARHFDPQDPTSGVDPELLHDETRFVVDFWQGKVAGPGYAARMSFRQSVLARQEQGLPLPIPPLPEDTIQRIMDRKKCFLTEAEKERFKKFHLWLNREIAQPSKFRPSEILLVLCGILEVDNAYDNVLSDNAYDNVLSDNALSSSSEKGRLGDIHESLCRDNIFKPLPKKGFCLEKINLMKPKREYLISSWYGTPPTKEKHFEESKEPTRRVQLEDALRAYMVSHLIETYKKSGGLVVDRNDKWFPACLLKRKDERPNYFKKLVLDYTSYDGYTAAFCAAATCSHQGKTGKLITKKGWCQKFEVMKYLDLNETLAELAMNGALFIKPSDGKLDNSKRSVIFLSFCLIFGLAALFFWLITTYSSTRFSINYKCETVFGGLVLQPYGVILANIIFFKVFERTINSVIDFFSYLYYKGHHEEDSAILEDSVEAGKAEMEKQQGGDVEAGKEGQRRNSMRPQASHTASTTRAPSLTDESRLHHKNEREARRLKPRLFVEVRLSPVKMATISIRDGDNPATVAKSFCKVYGLDQSAREVLEEVVRQSMEVNSVETEMNEKTRQLYVMHQYITAWKQDPHYQESDFAYQTPFIFFYLQLAYGLVSIIMACVTVSKLQMSSWDVYTALFGIISNSCVPMTFFQLFKLSILEKREMQMKQLENSTFIFLGIFSLFMITPFFTHLLPMIILYVWVIIFVFAALMALSIVLYLMVDATGIVAYITSLFQSKKKAIDDTIDNRVMEYLSTFYVELVLRFIVIFFVQTLFNYACAVYQFPIPMSPQQYLWVIVRDYQLRTQTYCYFQKSFNSGAAGIVLFTSFI